MRKGRAPDLRLDQAIDAKFRDTRPGEDDGDGSSEPPYRAAPVADRRANPEDKSDADEHEEQRLARQCEIDERAESKENGKPVKADALGKFCLKTVPER